jgi:hypothetical protein
LVAAHQLAAEQRDLDYFKEILKNFVEARAAEAAAKEAARIAKKEEKAQKAAAAAAAKKSTPKKPKAIADSDGDIDMAEATADDGELDVEKPAKSKKRKPEEDAEVN